MTDNPQTGAGEESRGGSLLPGTTSSAKATASIVIVATHGDGEPMVVGAPTAYPPSENDLATYASGGFHDAHFAREVVTYQPITLEQARAEHLGGTR